MKCFARTKHGVTTYLTRMSSTERAGLVALLEDCIDTMERVKAQKGRRFSPEQQALLAGWIETRRSLLDPEVIT